MCIILTVLRFVKCCFSFLPCVSTGQWLDAAVSGDLTAGVNCCPVLWGVLMSLMENVVFLPHLRLGSLALVLKVLLL